jgi:hypothetical protein
VVASRNRRPFVLGVAVAAAEMLLEVFALGFSAWRALVADFEVAPLHERPYYPSHLMVHRVMDVQPTTESTGNFPAEAFRDVVLEGGKAPRGLRRSISEVIEEIKWQSASVILRTTETMQSSTR